MPGVIIISIQGTTSNEIRNNISKLQHIMTGQKIFYLTSNDKMNPQIYYCDWPAIPTKELNTLLGFLRNTPMINQIVKNIRYSVNLTTI